MTAALAISAAPAPDDRLERALARIRLLEQENARLRCGATDADLELISEIYISVGTKAFTCHQVIGAPTVAAAADVAIGKGWTVRQLGNRLAKLQGVELDGRIIRRVGGQDRQGVVWVVEKTLRI